MVHVPAVTAVTVLPLTVQMSVVVELKLTVRPELAVALAVVVPPYARVVGLKVIAPIVWLALNLPVIDEVAFMLKTHVPVPVQPEAEPVPPDQPEKVELPSGVPVNVTDVPGSMDGVHVPLLLDPFHVQAMPTGLVIEPLPAPEGVAVRTY